MEKGIKMGDNIKTLVDKRAQYGDETIFVPCGTIGLVCDVFDEDAVLIETPDNFPFALVLYEKNEYEKVDISLEK